MEKRSQIQKSENLADWMWNHYEQHIVVEQKMPEDYNSLYETLRKRGQNLNTMLANLHIKVIQTLAKRTDAKPCTC